jgi:molybdopterin molybdotransferase
LSELDIADAQAAALSLVGPLPSVLTPLADALGRVLATDLRARWPLPGGDVATMDGWAVRSADLLAHPADARVRLRRAGESAAGRPLDRPLVAGEAARIFTGALLPPDADAVVAQEDTETDADGVLVDRARVGAFGRGHFMRAAGSDVAADARLLAAGAVLGPGELALLAGCGHAAAPVHRTPRVAMLCTGDELVPVGARPQRGQVVSSNGLMLGLQAREAGADIVDLGAVVDRAPELRHALERGLEADLLVTCGGISVGDHDLVLPTLLGLGAELHFRRVRMRPGRPTTLATLTLADRTVPVFALPGNPASAHVAFELFVRPVLRALLGHTVHHRPTRELVLAAPAPADPRRTHVLRVRIAGDQALPLPDQTSGALRSIAGHDALAFLSPGTDPAPAGTRVPALLLTTP